MTTSEPPRGSNPSAQSDSLRAAARAHVESGALNDAVLTYGRLLSAIPQDLEALNFLAAVSIGKGRTIEAHALLKQAVDSDPNDAASWKNLGNCLLLLGDSEGALRALDQALLIAPDFFVAQLHRAALLDRLDRKEEALPAYLRAVTQARAAGQWFDEFTTAPGLRRPVRDAIARVAEGRRQLFDDVMAPVYRRHGPDSMRRVERMLDNHLGAIRIEPGNSLQQPKFLYFPDLPETPYFDRSLFPWHRELEANAEAIRHELLTLLSEDRSFEPFLGVPPPGMSSRYLGGRTTETPKWNAYFFYRHGQRYEDNCARCPLTAAAIDTLPIVRIAGHAPETLFSVLGPGSDILPHHGVTNTRVVTHLPLIVPADCALRVAGIEHSWQQDRCVTFDDTFEHEAWNHGASTRVVLLFDTWNPHLTEAECDAVTLIVSAIGDLNRRAGIR